MINSFKALAGSARRFGRIYSHSITSKGARFILRVNNQFAGMFSTHAAAVDMMEGLSQRGGVTHGTQYSKMHTDLIKRRGTDMARRIGILNYYAVRGTNAPWNDWTAMTIQSFLSTPHPGEGSFYGSHPAWQGVRAFGSNVNPSDVTFAANFNFNPSSPTQTSPWMNVLYETLNRGYEYGLRTFHLHFPFGSDTTAWLGTESQWVTSYVSAVEPRECPARWKGFWEGVNHLLNGTMPAPAGGRLQLTQPVDIQVYLNGAAGAQEYRALMNTAWDGAGGATGGLGDAHIKSLLDSMIDRIKNAITLTKTGGILTICIDTAAHAGTPASTVSRRGLFGYKSDFCELADWYVKTKLEALGILVLCEGRPPRSQTQAIYSNTVGAQFLGTTVPEYYLGWGPYAGDGSWSMHSSPDNPNFPNIVADGDCQYVHLFQGAVLQDESTSRYGVRTKIYNGAAIRDWTTHPPIGVPVVYTPHHAMHYLYSMADVLADIKWRSGDKSRNWGELRVVKDFVTLAIDTYDIMGYQQLQPSNDLAYNGVLGNPCRYTQHYGLSSYMPTTWNLATFTADPPAYGLGYWTTTTKDFFNLMVRDDTSFLTMMANIESYFIDDSHPPNKVGPGFAWGEEGIYTSCISSEMRTP